MTDRSVIDICDLPISEDDYIEYLIDALDAILEPENEQQRKDALGFVVGSLMGAFGDDLPNAKLIITAWVLDIYGPAYFTDTH